MIKLELYEYGRYTYVECKDEFESYETITRFLGSVQEDLIMKGYSFETLEEEKCTSYLGKNKTVFAYVKEVD